MTAPRAPLPYGPNTAAVRRFLQRLAGMPATDCIAATRKYLELQRTPAFRAADRALGEAIDRAGLTDARDAVVGPIVQLMSTHAARVEAESGVTVDDLAESALAAALGILARDLIRPEELGTLCAPYAGIVGL